MSLLSEGEGAEEGERRASAAEVARICTTTLLTPTSFNRTALLTGTELNFSSTASDCLAWYNANPLPDDCGPQNYNGQQYTACVGANQMVDLIEASRGKVLELLTNNSESLAFGQLGAGAGLHFKGSVQGVLPLGPNGTCALNASLMPSPLSNPKTVEEMISYDYTLNLQGLTSNVSCSYVPAHPFLFYSLDGNYSHFLAYKASCAEHGGMEIWTNAIAFILSVNSPNLLAFWVCQSAPNGTPGASYTIYLAGLSNYKDKVGNITCTVKPIQSAIYPVMYQSTGNIFSTEELITSSPLAFPSLIRDVFTGMADVITVAQNLGSNILAEVVFDFGGQFFDLQPALQPQYLRLYEQMIQGMIEYEVTYLRLIYSTFPHPPSSCIRTVTGSLNYEVHGWFMTNANIGFLVPLTIINLGALVALAGAMIIAKDGDYIYHPSHPRPVVYDKHMDGQEQIPDEWMYKVSVRPTTTLEEYFDKNE